VSRVVDALACSSQVWSFLISSPRAMRKLAKVSQVVASDADYPGLVAGRPGGRRGRSASAASGDGPRIADARAVAAGGGLDERPSRGGDHGWQYPQRGEVDKKWPGDGKSRWGRPQSEALQGVSNTGSSDGWPDTRCSDCPDHR